MSLLIIRDELPLKLSTVYVILSLLVKINRQVPCVFQDSLPNVIDCLSAIELWNWVNDLWLDIVLDGEFDGLTCLVNLLHLYFPVLHNSYVVCKSFSFDNCRRLSLGGCDGFSILPTKKIFRKGVRFYLLLYPSRFLPIKLDRGFVYRDRFVYFLSSFERGILLCMDLSIFIQTVLGLLFQGRFKSLALIWMILSFLLLSSIGFLF